MEEVFKNNAEFAEYKVSNKGNVYSIKRKMLMKQRKDKDGYLCLTLYHNNKYYYKLTHRLVWETFYGKIPEGYEINHIDENPENANLDNLELVSHRSNINYGNHNNKLSKSLINNKNTSKPVLQFDLDGNFIKEYPSLCDIDREYGKSYKQHICKCCNGIRKTAYGYIWKYK